MCAWRAAAGLFYASVARCCLVGAFGHIFANWYSQMHTSQVCHMRPSRSILSGGSTLKASGSDSRGVVGLNRN